MITLYSGIPGSGKSYKMVYDLNDLHNKYYVVHNIDGLKEGFLGEYGIDFRKYCEMMNMEVIDFFSKEYQIEFTKAVKEKYDRNCLVIIDEAHEWFDRNRKQLKMWLSYHRHINQEIWLVAHRSTNLPAVYRSYIETEYRAKSGSMLALPGYFFYNRLLGGESAGYKFTKKKQKIFKLYKSQEKGFQKKKVSLYIPVIMLLAVAGVIYFFVIPQMVIGKNIRSVNKIKSSEGQLGISERAGDVSNYQAQQYRFVGVVGQTVMLEDNAGKVISLKDIPGQHVVLEISGSEYVKLYDIDKKKELIVNSYNPGSSVGRSIAENGKPTQH
jgi:zona occludens toxin (predicted ATPase)